MLINYCEKLNPVKEEKKEVNAEDKEAERNKKLNEA